MIPSPSRGATANGAAASFELLPLEALLLSRSYAYELFHKAFGGEPDEALLRIMGSEATLDVLDEYAEVSETFANLKAFLGRIGSKANDEGFLEGVLDEYVRFFQGPAQPPAYPWESPYVGPKEPSVFQPSTLLVREAYRARGLRVKKYQRMPDDHVSIMCAFMAALSLEALEAFRAGNAGQMRSALDAQVAFLRDHMVTWLPQYAELSLRVKKAVLYPQLAQGIAAFAKLDEVFAAEALLWLTEQEGEAFPMRGEAFDGGDPFVAVERALDELKALDLRGIEDNELVPIEGAAL